MDKQLIYQFLKACMGTQGAHYTNLKSCLGPKDLFGTDDTYFCGGVRKDYVSKEFERPKKEDYEMKTYFYADVDIRKTYRDVNGFLLVGEEFEKECNRVSELLMLVSKPNAIVQSGNGLHAYYIGEEMNISEDVYSIAVGYFLKRLNEKLGIYKADAVSKSKSAVSRLPGTYNKLSSEKKYNIDKQEVVLIGYLGGESEDRKNILEYYKLGLEQIVYKPRDIEVSNMGGSSLFEAINNINVAELFSKHTGLEIARDGKNFLSKRDGAYIGAFYSKELNIIISNGTHHLGSGDMGYCARSYVKKEILCTENNKEVVEYFKDKFSHIKQLSDEDRIKYLEGKKNVGEKEIIIEKKESVGRDPSDYKGNYYSWGNKILDSMIGFNEDHDLVVIHGTYGSGKTTFATNMVDSCGKNGIKSVLFTLEMNKEKLKKAQAIGRAGLTKPQIQEKNYSSEQLQVMKDMYNGYDKNFSLIGEGQSVDILDLCNNIRELYEDGYKLFVIDNLRKINVTGVKSDNQVDVAKMQALQSLKNELPICIVIIHHDNKSGTGFSGSQVIGDLADTIVHITKKLDPAADGKVTFNESVIDIYKERLNMVREFTFHFIKGLLRYHDSQIK